MYKPTGQAPTSSSSETSAYKLRIVAHDNGQSSFFYNMPTTTYAGLNDITFVNEGTVSHMASLALLHPGVSEATFLADTSDSRANRDTR